MILPSDPGFRYVGRFKGLGTDSVSIGWSNSTIECVFNGTSLGIQLEDPGENYFVYVVDGNPIRKSSKESEIVTGLEGDDHTLQIIKSTESGYEGPVVFKGLDVEMLGSKPADKSRKIFVSGASVSQGYGNTGCCENNPDPLYTDGPGCTGGDVSDCCPEVPLYQDAYLIYSAFLARQYGADLQNVGASGTGITKNGGEIAPSAPSDVCTEDKPLANEDTLPYIYTKQLLDDEPDTFTDWDSYVPDAMFIDAGSNDFTRWDTYGGGGSATRKLSGDTLIGNCSPSEEGFKEATIKWINTILGHWPKCNVFMLGWINDCAATRCPLFQQVVEEMNNPQVHFFDLSSLDSLDPRSEKAGCNAHPLGYSPVGGVSPHEEAANMINAAGFADILGWSSGPAPPVSGNIPPPPKSLDNGGGGGLSTGAITGIVIGALAIVAVIAVVAFGRKKKIKMVHFAKSASDMGKKLSNKAINWIIVGVLAVLIIIGVVLGVVLKSGGDNGGSGGSSSKFVPKSNTVPSSTKITKSQTPPVSEEVQWYAWGALPQNPDEKGAGAYIFNEELLDDNTTCEWSGSDRPLGINGGEFEEGWEQSDTICPYRNNTADTVPVCAMGLSPRFDGDVNRACGYKKDGTCIEASCDSTRVGGDTVAILNTMDPADTVGVINNEGECANVRASNYEWSWFKNEVATRVKSTTCPYSPDPDTGDQAHSVRQRYFYPIKGVKK